jgi:endonuclease/exonuclease/phosphatase family metal-dependent hydrolase
MVKKLSFFNKIVFFINSILATLLLLAYFLPYIPPKTFPFLAVLSLAVPILLILNILFVIYWLLNLKRQFLLSLIVLIIGYNYLGSFYKLSSSKENSLASDLTIMNYNVRLFNVYDWINDDNVEKNIENLVRSQDPDILSIQEYNANSKIDLSQFKYKYEKLIASKKKYGLAIFSNYPIVNSGSLEFPNTYNKAIYADVEKGNDTIRIYNLHLQSLRIDADVDHLRQEDSEVLFKRISNTFEMQQYQTELFLEHKKDCPYKIIISGDFNNTAFSYVYRQIKGDFIDTFEEAGNGFGRTYDFKFFPIRIDFILADKSLQINGFKNFNEKLSDHYPIMAKISLAD